MTEISSQPYRVLARKYRPATFAHMIGQDALVQTLSNAIALGRLAHAFILTGVRGVGKTSTARILAKGLNCEGPDGTGGPTMSPCGQCGPCKDINDGRHIDVLEMDAATIPVWMMCVTLLTGPLTGRSPPVSKSILSMRCICCPAARLTRC